MTVYFKLRDISERDINHASRRAKFIEFSDEIGEIVRWLKCHSIETPVVDFIHKEDHYTFVTKSYLKLYFGDESLDTLFRLSFGERCK